jgi:hypothetical protein
VALAGWSTGRVELALQLPKPLVGKLGPMLPGQKTQAKIQHAVDQVVDPIVQYQGRQVARRKERRLNGTAQMVGSSSPSQMRGSLSGREQLEGEHCGSWEGQEEREKLSGGVQLK